MSLTHSHVRRTASRYSRLITHKLATDFAVGDGVTNDTTAVLEAINTSTALELVFPSGYSFLLDPFTISRAGVTLIVESGATLVQADDVDSDDFILVTADDVTIRGQGTIDANRSGIASGDGNAIHATGNGFLAQGIEVHNAEGVGIYGTDCNDFTVQGTYVHDVGVIGIQARALTAGADMTGVRIQSNIVDRSDDAANDNGCIEVTRDNGARVIVSPVIDDNDCTMHLDPTGSDVVAIEVYASDAPIGGIIDVCVTNNRVRGSDIGISVASRVRGGSVGFNRVFNAKNIGIEVADSLQIAAVGNYVNGNGVTAAGMVLDGGNVDCDTCLFGNNVIRETLTYGIQVLSGTPYSNLNGNVVSVSGASCNAYSLSGSSDVSLNGNTADGNTTAATCLLITNCSRTTVMGGSYRRSANFGCQIVANGEAHTDNMISEGVQLHGTNGPVQLVEQNGGTLARTRREQFGNGNGFSGQTGTVLGSFVASGASGGDNLVGLAFHSGAPESAVQLEIGSMILRYGGTNPDTAAYIKTSTSGATGWKAVQPVFSGVTGSRPTVTTVGYCYWDTTLGKPIYWNGTDWSDAAGTTGV